MPLLPSFRAGALLFLAGAASAQQGADSPFTIRGFGTLGVVHSGTDEAEFIRDVTQPRGPRGGMDAGVDSRLGLQVNFRLGDSWEAVAQGLASRRFDGRFRPEVTWVFLKYQANDHVAARAGRLGFDVYLLADTRNVGYAYLWVRPPVEFFGAIPITSFDGGDVVVRGTSAGGFLSLKVFGGQALGRVPAGVPGREETFDLRGSPLMGLNLDFRRGDWGLRAAWAQLKFKREFNNDSDALLAALRDPGLIPFAPGAAGLAADLALTDKSARYLSLGLDYQRGSLTSQLSLSRTTSQSLALPTSHAGYLLVGYRLGAWTPFLNVAAVRTTPVDAVTGLPDVPPFDVLNGGVAQLLSVNQSDQRALSAGLRWDFRRNFSLKAQADLIQNRNQSTQLWWRPAPTWDGRALVTTLALDFTF